MICKNTDQHEIFNVKEMMIGTRELFTYYQCGKCSCLQLKDVPADLGSHYPDSYYSFKATSAESIKSKIKRLIAQKRSAYLVFGTGLIGRLAALHSSTLYQGAFKSLSYIPHLTKDMSIMDIGCGDGKFLNSLRELGFRKISGTDPFLSPEEITSSELNLQRKSVFDEFSRKYDVLMFHHVFEHLSNPFEVLQRSKELLNTNGVVIIRIPTVSSKAWETYREHWVELDAPRHAFLYSRKSISILANSAVIE